MVLSMFLRLAGKLFHKCAAALGKHWLAHVLVIERIDSACELTVLLTGTKKQMGSQVPQSQVDSRSLPHLLALPMRAPLLLRVMGNTGNCHAVLRP